MGLENKNSMRMFLFGLLLGGGSIYCVMSSMGPISKRAEADLNLIHLKVDKVLFRQSNCTQAEPVVSQVTAAASLGNVQQQSIVEVVKPRAETNESGLNSSGLERVGSGSMIRHHDVMISNGKLLVDETILSVGDKLDGARILKVDEDLGLVITDKKR